MKITIDTKEKTIELHENVSINELGQIVKTFNLIDYTILMEKVKLASSQFPIPREGNGSLYYRSEIDKKQLLKG